MFLTYIDESGKPNYNDTENEYVLAAITIHESEYRHVEDELSKVKQQYFPELNPKNVEIHATDIISRKGLYSKMDLVKRLQLLKDVLTPLQKIDAVINCVVIRKDLLNGRVVDLDNIAYKFLFERLCMTHVKLNKAIIRKGSDPQYGLLFMDSIQPKFDEKIKTRVRDMIVEGTEHIDNDYIIEDVVFVDSRYRAMSQIVDCIAYVVRRFHRLCFSDNVNEMELSFYSDCFNMIKPHLRKGPNRKIIGAGLKIFP